VRNGKSGHSFAYRKAGTVAGACKMADIPRATWYDWMQSNRDFARAALEAREEVADDLVGQAASEEGSDTLLITLLKALRRSVFGDKPVVTAVSDDVQQRLRRQGDVIREVLGPGEGDHLIERLDEVWLR
jgi:hypothetical protein